MHHPGSPTPPPEHPLNNFDAIRLGAAMLVLYSHHYTLAGGLKEPSFLGINTLGGLAVSVFFAISGYLVAQSWRSDPHPVRFALRRVLRIWPALTVVVLLAALVLGPLVTTLSPYAYFRHEGTRLYFSTLALTPAYYLPGVFTLNTSPAVNGSLWTIPLEVQCYVALLLAGYVGILKSPATLTRAAILYILWYTVWHSPEASNGQMNHALELGAYFAAGALMHATQRHWQARRLGWLLVLMLLAFAFWHLGWRYFAALLVLPYATIVGGTASTPWLRRVGRLGDFSYGAYLYAFPVQQTVIMLWLPALGFWASMAIAAAITLLCAAASWHLVEKPALAFKPRKTTQAPALKAGGKKLLAFAGFAFRPAAAIALMSVACWAWLSRQAPAPLTFFSPSGYTAELAQHTRLGMVNAVSPEQLRESLLVARQHGAQLQIDFSLALLLQRPAADIGRTYEHEGQRHPKSFAPLPANKIKDLPSQGQLPAIMAPYWPVMQAFRAQISAIFLVDEPYMHGISRAEMERLARHMRQLLHERQMPDIPLGITFSAAMFDQRFAQMVSAQASRYVHRIEQHYRTLTDAHDAHAMQWVDEYKRSRLTSYDLAGNYYTGGGIPKGFDIIGYNLYTATLLQDAVQAETLSWFAELNASPACTRFKGLGMPDIRAQLSFYRDGPVAPDGQDKDRPLLDAIFTCKSESILHLLKLHAPAGPHRFQLWGESSANGFMEFNARGEQEPEQPNLLVASRVQDEVQRTLRFYDRHKADYGAGVVFFTWDDAIDHSIGLHIMGARSMPGVTQRVFERTSRRP